MMAKRMLGRLVPCRTVAGRVCFLSIAELAKEAPEVSRKPAPPWPATSSVEFLPAIPCLLTFFRPKNPPLSMACSGLCTDLPVDSKWPVCLPTGQATVHLCDLLLRHLGSLAPAL